MRLTALIRGPDRKKYPWADATFLAQFNKRPTPVAADQLVVANSVAAPPVPNEPNSDNFTSCTVSNQN